MPEWKLIKDTGYPDQEADIAGPFYAQVGPEGTTAWSWTLLRSNRDGTSTELTGSGAGTPAASEDLAKLLAEAAGLGAQAQFETAEPPEPAEVTSATYFSADNYDPPNQARIEGFPVTVGAQFWSNDLRVVKVTELARHQNAYSDTGCVQTWHETTEGDGGRGGSFDTLSGAMRQYGRLARWFEGKNAEDYAPGTQYADIKGARR